MNRQVVASLRCFKRSNVCTLSSQHICHSLDTAYRTVLGVTLSQSFEITMEQKLAVKYAMQGLSVFLHLPTGAGKSLGFQVPALMAAPSKVTLVISPLVALIQVRLKLY